jgi:hypothetical protein|tara:strand:- start:394 stop:903 length:510 start_codon:yes stop_codon:yes gene_type:complete
MPNARRVIFSSYVVPTQSVEAEETSIRHTEFQASPNGTLGGKGSATINATQWGDGWTSFSHSGAYWEDQSDVWELQGETWSGELSITTTATDQNLTDDTSDLAFVYIKNTGDTNNALVSLNRVGGNYYIIVPPNGSVHLRGDGTDLACSDLYVKSNTSTTTIEFIIAKE